MLYLWRLKSESRLRLWFINERRVISCRSWYDCDYNLSSIRAKKTVSRISLMRTTDSILSRRFSFFFFETTKFCFMFHSELDWSNFWLFSRSWMTRLSRSSREIENSLSFYLHSSYAASSFSLCTWEIRRCNRWCRTRDMSEFSSSRRASSLRCCVSSRIVCMRLSFNSALQRDRIYDNWSTV
jgi:hypothetical protein